MGRAAELRVVRWTLSPTDWPRGARLRIALLADLHLCRPWTPKSVAEAAIEVVQAQTPDLILLLGDYAAHLPFGQRYAPDEIAKLLSGLSAPLGVFNVFGNHDWWTDREGSQSNPPRTHWHRAFDDAGIETLENRAIVLDHGGHRIALAGVASQMALGRRGRNEFKGLDNLDAALDGVPRDRFTLLMAHEPDIFARLPAHVNLTLSGHTHGGQIRPFGRALAVPSQFGARYAYGVIEESGRHLVVSGGVGYSVLPFRWAMPPEITVVELS